MATSQHGEFLPEESEVKVVTGYVKKKVNELARQGYRLALIHNQVAVMRRSRYTTASVSYIELDGWKKKSFVRQTPAQHHSRIVHPRETKRVGSIVLA